MSIHRIGQITQEAQDGFCRRRSDGRHHLQGLELQDKGHPERYGPKGDPIGQDASGNWKGALATTGSVVQARLVALQGGALGEVIEAVRGCCIIGGRITGATGGNSI